MVHIADRSCNSVERLTSAIDNMAATYGKSGVEKLIAQRDQMIQRLSAKPAVKKSRRKP